MWLDVVNGGDQCQGLCGRVCVCVCVCVFQSACVCVCELNHLCLCSGTRFVGCQWSPDTWDHDSRKADLGSGQGGRASGMLHQEGLRLTNLRISVGRGREIWKIYRGKTEPLDLDNSPLGLAWSRSHCNLDLLSEAELQRESLH